MFLFRVRVFRQLVLKSVLEQPIKHATIPQMVCCLRLTLIQYM